MCLIRFDFATSLKGKKKLTLSVFVFLQLRYKETFELSKGHYHTVKDALDILCHRRVTDDISEVSN